MLKTLLLRKKQDGLNNKINNINSKLEEIRSNEDSLLKEVEGVEELTEEEQKVVEEKADELIQEKKTLEEEKAKLLLEVEEIEKELQLLEEKIQDVEEVEEKKAEERNTQNEIETRGDIFMNANKREMLLNLVKEERNAKFFEEVRNLMLRASETTLTNKELLVPEQVLAFINQEVVGYGEIVKLVDRISLKGTARIVVNGGTPKLFWTEKCASLQEATLGEFQELELDNYKLGGYVFLCKAFVEDAIIDVAQYIIKEFAKAIATALDEAIINGQGADQKQPQGILKALEEDSEVSATNLLGVLTAIGGLNARAKNITLVVNRKTYYSRILPETFGKNDKGQIVYGLGQTLPDGTKVVISQAVKDDKFIVGDFKQYKLGIRKEMAFDTSDQVRWIEEQIGYKTSGRYDGKVADKTFFAKGQFVNAG